MVTSGDVASVSLGDWLALQSSLQKI